MTNPQSALSHPKYRPDIDGLRAIAVLSVVAYHAFPSWLSGGFIGVDIFFVISGFLISTIIFENLERGTFTFAEFYARRVKRIFPALLLVLIASFVFGWFVLLPDEYKQLGKHIAAGAGFVSNLVLRSEAGYFDNLAETKPLLHLWSLGIEEQFYIVWPLVLWLAWKWKFNLLTITTLVAVISFYLNIKGIKLDAVATFYSPQTRFWELLCGSLLAWISVYEKGAYSGIKTKLDRWLGSIIYRHAREADGKTLANVLSFVGLLLLAYGFWRINKDLDFPGKWAVLPVLGSVLLITAGSEAWVNRTVLGNRVAVWFGLISFPLYLWHWPILSFARIVEGDVLSRNTRITAVLLSVVLAWLTYMLVERRIRLGGHNKVKVITLVILMTIVGYVGYNTYSRDGLKFRIKSKVGLDEQAIKDERAKYWAGSLEKNYKTSPEKILIFGDSQAFDIYKALINYDMLGVKTYLTSYQCTSFNLPKLGVKLKEKICQDAFEKLISSPEIKSANIFVYSIFWEKGSESAQSLENYHKILSDIKVANPNIKVVFFGPKPHLGKTWVSINTITRWQKSVVGMDEFLNKIKWIKEEDSDYVKHLAGELGVDYVDVNEVFCLDGCQFYIDNQYTYFDQNHWTEFGAKLFADKLERSNKFSQLLVKH